MSSSIPPPDELLGDPLYARLKQYLIESTGLAYYVDKDADLARRLHRRLSTSGLQNCSSYLERLRDPDHGPSELNALIAEITIGESYFFRHPEHFDALRDLVLPEVIARKAPGRRLHVWCAGCADGAEPYSLSIILRRDLAHLLAGWELSILATDINPRILATAAEGKFEEWCLRSTSEELRQACFRKDGKQWRIAPEFKKGLLFQVHNLLDPLPAQLNPIMGFDLIICRNVMIYFGSELMRRIVSQFHTYLTPGAWLLVGPSEPNMTCFRSFRAVNAPGVTLYQKPVEDLPNAAEPVAASPQVLRSSRWMPETRFSPPPLTPSPKIGPVGARAPVSIAGAHATLELLRKYSDQGNWDDAVRCAEDLLERDNLNPLVHFHYALILEHLNNPAEAERSYRKTIYLDRKCVLAHYHLGLLLRSLGDTRHASRFFENTLSLLGAQSGQERVPGADGLTVEELKKLTQMQMALPGGAA